MSIKGKSEASEIHYRNMRIKSYCFRSIRTILFSFTVRVRINCILRSSNALGAIVNSQRIIRPLRDMSSV